ncbi:unnamed protein product [Pieris macdunnoughi]|uniref:Uncharacterized protein n=1 Tax=Pieris macdunnoughi TaxID=345717 RepID=A0A821UA92_9NEOP|nr:unnamed protein product [Pieris macdunnoughi]
MQGECRAPGAVHRDERRGARGAEVARLPPRPPRGWPAALAASSVFIVGQSSSGACRRRSALDLLKRESLRVRSGAYGIRGCVCGSF